MLSFVNWFGHDVLSQQRKIKAEVLTRESVTVVFLILFCFVCLLDEFPGLWNYCLGE